MHFILAPCLKQENQLMCSTEKVQRNINIFVQRAKCKVQKSGKSIYLELYVVQLCETLMISAYLIFVIFFTQTRFLENKIYTEERVNYDKRISRQNSVNQDLQITKKSSNYTLCVKLHTECKSTLGLCKNKRHNIWHKVCQITHGV